MKRINRRTAICLIISLLLGVIYISPISVAKKKPRLSQKIVTMNGNETKTITILNLKKKYIKSVKAVNQFREIVDVKIQNKTNIIITSVTTWNNAFPWVAIKLKRKIGGKKHYELGFKVEVKGGDETTVFNTSTPTPNIPTLVPIKTPVITTTPKIMISSSPSLKPSPTSSIKPTPTSTSDTDLGKTKYITNANELLSIGSENSNEIIYVLKNDIEMSGTNSQILHFCDTLDGNNKKILGLTRPLIKENRGTIKNIIFEDVNIITDFDNGETDCCGTIAEQNCNYSFEGAGIIENCTTKGQIKVKGLEKSSLLSNYYLGGISNDGIIKNCNSYINITCNESMYNIDYLDKKTKSNILIGGIAGSSSNKELYGDKYVENCNNYGEIIAATATAGGVVGEGGAIHCNNYGNIQSTNNSLACGGIIAVGSVWNCNNYGNIDGKGAGIASSGYTIEESINYGNITGQYIAGIAGGAEIMKKCCNKGELKVSTSNSFGVYGIVGTIGSVRPPLSTEGYLMQECVNKGSITIDDSSSTESDHGISDHLISGIVGENCHAKISNCCNLADIIVVSSFNPYYYFQASGIVNTTRDNNGQVINCYNGGKCTYGISANSVEVDNCYYIKDNAELRNYPDTLGIIDTDQYETGIDGNDKLFQSTYNGFDFDNIWIMTPNGPDLKWNQ